MFAIVMSTKIMVIQSVLLVFKTNECNLCQVVKCYKNLTFPSLQHHIIIPLNREAKCLAVFKTIHKSEKHGCHGSYPGCRTVRVEQNAEPLTPSLQLLP